MSEGYKLLKEAVMRDIKEYNGTFNENGCNECIIGCRRWCDKFKWVIDRAKHYEEKLQIPWADVLNSWEKNRNYWYMNYYQDCNQPLLETSEARVFETIEDLRKSVGNKGFRCPACNGISTSAYKCNSGLDLKNCKPCDWKVYGLFGDLGKGIYIYVKETLDGQRIFMPIAWE